MSYRADDIELPRASEDALAWYTRLSSDQATQDDWDAHAEWLAADPAHLEEFAAVQATFDRIDAAGQEIRDKDRAAASSAAAEGAARHTRPNAGWHFGFFTQRPFVATGFAAAAVAIFIIGGVGIKAIMAPDVVRIATTVGEVRQVTLPDGSTAALDTDTALVVAYANDRRSVELQRGRAIFDVRHDPEHPFVVKADDHVIRVLGTKFEVDAIDEHLTVAVSRGLVGVTSTNAGGSPPAKVSVGKKLVFSAGATSPVEESVDPENIGSWTEHRLIFDAAPLGRVLRDVNRYFSGAPIHLADETLDKLPFTGSLYVDDAESVARNLSSFLSLAYERDGNGFALKRSTSDKSGT